MSKKVKIFITLFILASLIFIAVFINKMNLSNNSDQLNLDNPILEEDEYLNVATSPMFIETLRQGKYPGDDFIIEQTLANGTNYKQYIASYLSEGLKIYGLLTIPIAPKPENGFPAIVFVHGYIPPKEYLTTGNYPTYQARLARSGFITFKPDLRGHGNSEGEAVSAHNSEKYVIDVMNSISYLKIQADVNPAKIGYWGHSNGGEIGLRIVVISPDIKAAVFWAGVVGSYVDMLETYNDKIPFLRNATSSLLVKEHGLPSENPEFWNKLDPYFYLEDISAPIQLHHGTSDPSVPIELSRRLKEELEKINKPVELYEYPGDNHNISNNLNTAWQRTIDFYNENL
ncbi:MAG: alpha/beta fold hydrolase [Patescibacteria group bacterium]